MSFNTTFRDVMAAWRVASAWNKDPPKALHTNGPEPKSSSPSASAANGLLRAGTAMLARYGDGAEPDSSAWLGAIALGVEMVDKGNAGGLPPMVHDLMRAARAVLPLIQQDKDAARGAGKVLEAAMDPSGNLVLTAATEAAVNPGFRNMAMEVARDPEAREAVVQSLEHLQKLRSTR